MSDNKVEYVVTKEQCEQNIKGVCEGCGGPLVAMETVDNAGNPTHWTGCPKCCKFRQGIDAKYFKIARKLVEENIIRPYGHMVRCDYEDSPSRLEYYLETQTAGLVFTIQYIDGLLKEYK